MFYLLNIFVMVFYYHVIVGKRYDKVDRLKKFALLAGIHIILFRALANPYNYVDTDGYATAFSTIRTWTFKEAVLDLNYYTAWGQFFVLINWAVGQISDNLQWLYAVVSIFGLFPIMFFHYKLSRNILLSVIMFLVYPMMYYMGFGVLRQHLAVAYVLLALYHVDNIKVSLIYALIATLCHTTALVFFPFYLFNSIDKLKLSKLWWIFIVVVGSLLIRIIMMYVAGFFERYESIGEEGDGNTLPLIVMGGLSVLILICGTLNKSNVKERATILFVFYGVTLAIASLGLQGLGRLTLYNMYVVPVATTYLLRNHKGRVFAYWFILAYFLLTAFLITNSEKSYIYVPFWQDVYNPTV